ncbi:cytochrome p450 [Moniliophthora roreri MCA 2997]|uniref:Cytochrome p450 n=1 Tax=Moniliophthora roreri (strain MCA 2997) TaxID=1381753 RepID=V2WWL8_MONRO|nr:cytochrome p450 [Moniliophthora roreri MCA 2997]
MEGYSQHQPSRPRLHAKEITLKWARLQFGNTEDTKTSNPGLLLAPRYTTSIVMIAMYGECVHPIRGNGSLSTLYEILENVTTTSIPDSFLELDLYGGFLKRIEAVHKPGINRADCFVSKYLKVREASTDETVSGGGVSPSGWIRDLLLIYVTGSAIEAGSDTTASSTMLFILFISWYLEVLRRVREEVDRVVGSDRLPTFEDKMQLPYVIACIKELLWRRPPTPVGVPHRLSEDAFYNDYFIPKDNLVFGNVWAIDMNPL